MTDKSEIILDSSTPATTETTTTTTTESTATTFGGYATVEELVAAHDALKAQSVTATQTAESTETTQASKEIPSGEAATTTDEATAQKTVTDAGLDWSGLNDEYANAGKLSDETYAALEAKGIPRDAVDTYIRGRQAEADAYDTAVFGAAGGQAEYSSLVNWAANALTQAEKEAFNEAVVSGNAAKASLAVEALAARRARTTGTPPVSLLKGNAANTGVQPYKSREEMTADFRSARYKSDPAFRELVTQRMRVTHQ
jgi:hypothetical protein